MSTAILAMLGGGSGESDSLECPVRKVSFQHFMTKSTMGPRSPKWAALRDLGSGPFSCSYQGTCTVRGKSRRMRQRVWGGTWTSLPRRQSIS